MHPSERKRIRDAVILGALCVSSALLGACGDAGDGTSASGGSSGGPAKSGPPELRVVKGAPQKPGEEPASAMQKVEGYTTAMASVGSLVTVGTTTGVYELSPAGPNLLPIVGDEPDLPQTTGIVRAMAGFEDGVLVAAENDILFTPGGVLQRSAGKTTLAPLGVRAMSARVADDDGDMELETHLAIVGEKSAYELGEGSLVTWSVEGETSAPTAMLAQKERVFLAYGHRVYEIDKAMGKAYPLVFDVGYVSEMACGSLACEDGSLVYFASDWGLVERSASGDYSLYTLAAEGGALVPVTSFALDGAKQRLYATAGEWVLRLRAGEIPDAVATLPPAEMPRKMVVDKIGDVWTGAGTSLTKFALGTPLSFLTDVRPIMHEYCADCHAAAQQGAPKIQFEEYDVAVSLVERILARAAVERSMPPGTYEKKLPADKISILKEWAVTKAP